MQPAEYNYEIYNKKILAVIRSLKNWRPELQGVDTRIEIYTDYKTLEYFITTKRLNSRQARWAEILPEYFFIIIYRTGRYNVAADAFIRRAQNTSS